MLALSVWSWRLRRQARAELRVIKALREECRDASA
jgi:hypothetical protein